MGRAGVLSGLRDYEEWHRQYDDATSPLSWRLRVVQGHVRRALDARPGPFRVLSSCAGDGRDVLEVLAERDDAARVSATLIELHPAIAERARAATARLSAQVEVRVADAGFTDAYTGAVPADLVLLVGILGNISDDDLGRTIAFAPQLCAQDATLVWSRGHEAGDDNGVVRSGLEAAGFAELDYAALDTGGGGPAVGAARYEGPPAPFVAGRQLFKFLR